MLARYLYTIFSLKPVQILYQIKYRLRRYWRKVTGFSYRLSIPATGRILILKDWISKPVSLDGNSFSFLNLDLEIENGKINWSETKFGKLWSYNLNYMDYLLQPGMTKDEGLDLMGQFIDGLSFNTDGLEPYPISLRTINWIKFISKNKIIDSQIDNSLYAQYHILSENLEYHILGNHLLENGFSLLFGAFYFKDKNLYYKAENILVKELTEQILQDGCHFELSPMYHQIILDRLLDCINLLQNNQRFDNQKKLLELMLFKTQSMLDWLNAITFSNGEIPLLNDSVPGIAPSTQHLIQYAFNLNIKPSTFNVKLSASGYRKFTSSYYECIIDIGQIGPSYQPGHAHADTFSFVINLGLQSFIVDSGISTYQRNENRHFERSTSAHNTVVVGNKNSSDVWSAFRVGQRAGVFIIKDDNDHVIAYHDGYRKFKSWHKREWQFSESEIRINDSLEGRNNRGTTFFHFAPETNVNINSDRVICNKSEIQFFGADDIELVIQKIPVGYNKYAFHQVLKVNFSNNLNTILTFNS